MIRVLKWHIGSLLTVAALLLFTDGRAEAQCFGDCNASGTLTASDIGRVNSTILRCGPCAGNVPGGIATGCATLAGGCPPADFNTDGCLRASELARANQNILRYQPSGCQPTNTPDGAPTPTPTTVPTDGFCGDMSVGAGEECDDGGACFGGANAGQLCTTQAACPGGKCEGFGGDGCAKNCTTEKTVSYVFSGAVCKGGPTNGAPCKFIATCVGGPTAGRPCTLDNQCGGGTCVSECGAGATCYGDGECTAGTVGGSCFMLDSSNEAKFCSAGTNSGKACNSDVDCPGAPAGSCKGSCGTNGVCENKSRSALISLSLPVNIGPMIGSSILHFGQPDPTTGLVPVATHFGDTIFDPVKVPGLVCACVRGGIDAGSHGPGNTGSGNINCGAGTIANDVTLGQDHNTTPSGTCIAGANIGAACNLKCAPAGTRAGLPCFANSDCPGTTAAQRQCNGTTDCGISTGCNIANGPGTCVGGTSVGRSCFNNNQCLGGGKCTGKCVSGTVGAACSCDGTSRFCGSGLPAPNDVTQCGSGGLCRVTGNGGGFCMGPPRFCVGGTGGGKACYNDAECGGGTCPGTGNFLKACTSNADCPGSLCNSIDDATCTLQDPIPPEGSGAKACGEKKQICTTGTIGVACTADNQCGAGGKCGTQCSAQSPHPGVCNSPAHITVAGNAGSGSALFLNTISIGTISDGGTCGLAALCMGGTKDLQPCLIAADCTGGGICATAVCGGTCSNDPAKLCIANTDCVGGTCNPGTNFKGACTSDANCGGTVGACAAVPNFAAGASLGNGKGLDGLPCTDDDAAAVRGNAQTIPQTTGRGSAFLSDVGNIAGQQYLHKACVDSADPSKCLSTLVGQPLSCAALLGATPSASGLRLTSVFPTLDGQTGDAVVLTFLTAR